MARVIEAFEQFFDASGDPLVDGRLYFYQPGSTTLKNTYADVGEETPNTNPVLLSGEGRAPNVFGTGSYRVILTDKNSVQIQVRDPVGGVGTQEFGSYWNSLVTYQIGDIVRDGNYYYQGQSVNNVGNQPSTDGGSNWITWPPNTEDAEIYADEAAASAAAAAASESAAEASASSAAADAASASSSASSASSSASVAQSSANFLGDWSTLTGPASVPSSVYHNAKYWMLLVDIPDITASEPGVSSDWALIPVGVFWEAETAAGFTVTAGGNFPVDISSGNVTATFESAYAVGDQMQISASGSNDYSCTTDRNGVTILSPDGTAIDSSGDGNLILENGDTVTLIAVATDTVRIV